MIATRPQVTSILTQPSKFSLTVTAGQTITPIITSAGVLEVRWGDGAYQMIAPNTTAAVNHTYAAAGRYVMELHGDVSKISVLDWTSDPYNFDFAVFARRNWASLGRVQSYNSPVTGSIDAFLNSPLTYIDFRFSSLLTGSIDSFAGKAITLILLTSNTLLTGSINSFAGAPLVNVSIGNVSLLTGTVNTFAGRALTTVYLNNLTLITGALSDFASAVCASFTVSGTAVDGDAGGLSNIAALKTVDLRNNNWTESEVDAVLGDVEAGQAAGKYAANPTGKTLNISGTNAAPSAAGLASETYLEANGWTVTVTA